MQPKPIISSKSSLASTWQAFQSIVLSAVIIATLLTLWTPANLFSNQLLDQMWSIFQSQGAPIPTRSVILTPTRSSKLLIGIIAGHSGNQKDPGAVCEDGLTEKDINVRIATLVKQDLIREGFEVDLLEEFDPRLKKYKALALISIHNDSCKFINKDATGFKIAASNTTLYADDTKRLAACLRQGYQNVTNMRFHNNTITKDMREYHAFEEIDRTTPAAIIETGFLNLDRQILTKNPDKIARGVTEGILCFVRNEKIDSLETPSPKP